MDRVLARRLLPQRAFVGLVAAATVVALISTGQLAAGLAYADKPVPWTGLLKARLVDWYLYALFVPLLYRAAIARPISRESWAAALQLYIPVGLACALAKETLFTIIADWFRPGVFGFARVMSSDYLDSVLLFWGMTGCISLWGLRGRPRQPAFKTMVNRFVVSDGNGYRVVPADDVQWINAQGNYAQLNTAARGYLVRETMTSLERRLGEGFVRVHRSAIVNRSHVYAIEPLSHGAYAISLSSGARVITSRSYNSSLRRLIA
jgi:two-component system LytT family response regulator